MNRISFNLLSMVSLNSYNKNSICRSWIMGMRAFLYKYVTLYLFDNNICGNISLLCIHHSQIFFIIQKLLRMSWQYRRHFSLWLTQRKEIILLFTFCNLHANIRNMENETFFVRLTCTEYSERQHSCSFHDGTISEIMPPTEILPHPK